MAPLPEVRLPEVHPPGSEQPGARFSVVMPVLDEARVLAASAPRLARLAAAGCELILADGGSTDGSAALGESAFHAVVRSAPGRARQMNAGARRARAPWLVFAHADTALDAVHVRALDDSLQREPARRWGRFDVRLSGADKRYRLVERAMNVRSRLTGIATGDQSIFVRADEFAAVGGYRDQPLMEDVALSATLRRRSRPLCLRVKVTTSSRRWERDGVLATIQRMWRLRLAYALGASPDALVRDYYPDRRYDGAPAGPPQQG